MKKIINGRLYDTTTAKSIGSWSNIADVRNFHYYCETLYLKRNGEYFLYGEGGPASKYSHSNGDNSWSGGEMITPLTYATAVKWAEEHLTADEYASAFGMPDEDEEPVVLNVHLPAPLMAAVRSQAQEQHVSLTDFVRAALESATTK